MRTASNLPIVGHAWAWTSHALSHPSLFGSSLSRLADVSLHPDSSQLPGSNTLQQLTNGIAGWALILALVALLIGAVIWALGSHSQNYHQAVGGRRAVLVSGAAALLIGAAPTLINFFFHTGQKLH